MMILLFLRSVYKVNLVLKLFSFSEDCLFSEMLERRGSLITDLQTVSAVSVTVVHLDRDKHTSIDTHA